MAIDACPHSFSDLAAVRLPLLMQSMREQLKVPAPLALFAQKGIGIAALSRHFKLKGDFPGCYVLVDDTGPFYVGISRGVLTRLRQHVRGKTHFDASLAYLMASKEIGHELLRDEAMANSEVRAAFERAQGRLRQASAAFIAIPNDLELYLFEAYCAMELDTSVWNTFRTH